MPPRPLDPHLYQRVIDALEDAVFVVDRDRRVVFFNRAAEELTGLQSADVLGRSCSEALRCPVCGPTCRVIEGVDVRNQHFELPTAGGGRVLVRRTAVPLRDDENHIVGVVETLREQDDDPSAARVSRPSRPWDPEEAAPLRAIVGRSQAIRRIVDTIRRLARSDASVLVTGESGTGKELVARAIHGVCRRKDKAFVAVNCAALPADLIESELFGHVRGAFTGAVRDRLGAVEAAEGGTFFLDEIGDLHPSLQAKLLRLLQERTFQRIGESITRTADIRVVAATHVDLDQAVAQGTFREDLYYRLRVVPIHIPALRERREDIAPLANYLLTRRAVAAGRRPMRFTPNAMRVIEAYGWPGNVRELVNAVDYVIALSTEDTVTDHDLPEDVSRPRVAAREAAGAARGRYVAPQDNDERMRIEVALRANHYHRQRTADALGMDRVTLYRKLEKYGIADGPRARGR
jgi:PAS domain S-box-containing protein